VLDQIISGPLSYLILSFLILSYLILSYLILSYLILSYLIVFYLILSFLIFSYLIISRDTGVQTEDESEGSVNGWKFPEKVNLITYSYSNPIELSDCSSIIESSLVCRATSIFFICSNVDLL